MVVLLKRITKKVKGSTLVEVLVASVLIIVVFAIASLSLNNVLKSTIKGNKEGVENELNKLQYLHSHRKIADNYSSDFNNWQIKVVKSQDGKNSFYLLQATNSKTDQRIVRNLQHEVNQ